MFTFVYSTPLQHKGYCKIHCKLGDFIELVLNNLNEQQAKSKQNKEGTTNLRISPHNIVLFGINWLFQLRVFGVGFEFVFSVAWPCALQKYHVTF